ncbi:hypothetical protein H5410_054199 [Solanum commersonii]|uniref:Disease resistance protein At4g27190-like leucine-rich repeats domain-containing protein n=1 Tax=Solanum commersonii TaxID=4109 RepID=A0A9J5X8K2_SOLCO|nr:hypothetical protein H5410_054199 [Solanum commersonii]
MEEVIRKGGGIMTVFPLLEKLELRKLPKLGHFFLLICASPLCYSTSCQLNKVLTELQLNEFQNVKYLSFFTCDLVTHLFNRTHEVINLYELPLEDLDCPTHICSDNVERIEFPLLQTMFLFQLPEFQNFWPTANNSNPLFDEKVSCPNLEELFICHSYISALCSHQLPTDYFTKLRRLDVWHCGKLRNLMSPSVAKGLLNLRVLWIQWCKSMEEVITKGEGIMNLFPRLEELKLYELPKLAHFFLTNHALEFPFLRFVDIDDCPEMKTFVQQGISVSTPSLERVNYATVKEDDLNKWIQQRFNSKEQEATDDDETSDDDEAEPSHARS